MQKNKEQIGKQFEVFVDEGRKGNWIARNNSYKQIIINSEEQLYGKTIKAKIVDAGACDLKADKI